MKDQERVPLRVVLRNFLNHIENLESQSCPEKSYEAEFQDLKIFSENVKCLKEYSCLEGEKEVNRKKNRYKDILPFDLSRVVLNEYAGIPGSDYINANFIKGASGSPAYIASQGPLPSTVNDFWRMVVQCEVQVIVMACNEEEAGKAKCEKYWVDDGEEKQFGMISVKLLKSSTVCPDFSVRTMRLKYTNSQSVLEERTVCQLHYVAWPDHGVPSVVQPLLDMVRLVRDTQASETLPVLVHCSAGCGRTGTICAIDYVWGLLRTGKLTSDFSLLGLIRDMRKQRIAMVQTKEQYVLVHQAVRELFKEQLCMIDSHPYENVDPNGLLVIKDEENAYDCIEYVSTCSSEEKHDNKKEKEIKPPPLPCKRNLTLFSSKHEKDVENLTAQQRAIYSLSNNKNYLTISQLSDKKKNSNRPLLKSTVEKSSKKGYDNQIKVDSNKPIPSKGILRVPQLETLAPKCSASIKRSKSLKVVSSCDKGNLTFCPSSPTENKRRSSLESNFDELGLDTEYELYDLNKLEFDHFQEQRKKNIPQKLNKYDLINIQEQRPLLRSLTSLDLRQKLHSNNFNSGVNLVPFSNKKVKQKCKLLRSNTQINVVKRNDPLLSNLKNPSLEPSVVDQNSQGNSDEHNTHYSHLLNFSVSIPNHKEQNLHFSRRPTENSSLSMKHNITKPSSDLKEPFHRKINELPKRPVHSFHNVRKSISNKVPRDQSKILATNSARSDGNALALNSFTAEKSSKPVSKLDKCSAYGLKLLTSSSHSESSDSSPINYQNPSYLRTNHLKQMTVQKKIQLGKPLEMPLKNELSLPSHGFQKDSYICINPHREDARPRQVSSNNEDFMHSNSFLVDDPTFGSHHPNSFYNDSLFHGDDMNDLEHGPWVERDRMHITYNKRKSSKEYFVNISRPHSLLHKAENNDSSRTLINNELDVSKTKVSSIMLESVDETDGCRDLNTFEALFNKDGSSLLASPSDIKYPMHNRKNVHQYNVSIHGTRNTGLIASNNHADVAVCLTNRLCKSAISQQRCAEPPAFSQESPFYIPGFYIE
nr:tyrosine-protein phosphatase non-receptor type 12 [Halyomorpha halys]